MNNHDAAHKAAKLKLSISDSVRFLNTTDWNQVVGDRNVYLSAAYLASLEDSLHDVIDFRYVLFYDPQYVPVGVAIVQLLHFTNKELDIEDIKQRFGHLISEKMIAKLDARVMLCGNAFSTGENGFLFIESISDESAKLHVSKALFRLKRDEKKANKGVSIILLKDFWPESFDSLTVLEQEDYSAFEIDVNMVIRIRDNWKTYDDYLQDLVTKFRTKVKSVYKKSSEISDRRLSAPEILELTENIDQLYDNVLMKADYRFGALKGSTLYRFAKEFPERFIFIGYFLKEELVGFSSSFHSGHVIDANFVGINYQYNYDLALYQRILCDLTKLAIDRGVTELRLGRTAEEMKSCFGAEPVGMKLLVKHRNSITNKLVKHVIHHISPSKFEIRKPFKAEVYQQN